MSDIIYNHKIEVTVEGDAVIIEPPAVHSTRGFSVYLTSAQAKALGYKLLSAAVRMMPVTVKMDRT